MIRDLNARAARKGYTIEKEPVSFTFWLIGTISLPVWFDFNWLYISPKKTRYYALALAQKFEQKRDRRKQRRRKELFGIMLNSGIHPKNPYSF